MTNSPILQKDRRSTINFDTDVRNTVRNYLEAKENFATFDRQDLLRLRSDLINTLQQLKIHRKLKNSLKNHVTDKSEEALLNYLLGDITNHNLYGTILSFTKKGKFSFLLYFSHETGRVERILFNNATSEENLFSIYANLKINKPLEERELEKNFKYRTVLYSEKFQKRINSYYPIKLLNLDLFKDGKTTKQFFDQFLVELMRDYLWTFRSFGVTDMKYLKQCTSPINVSEYQNTTYTVGCGDPIESEIKKLYPGSVKDFKNSNLLNHFQWYNAYKFIDYQYLEKSSPDNQLFINVPEKFNWKSSNTTLNKYNLQTICLSKDKTPQSVKDLKKYINSRTVTDRFDLLAKVMTFNKNQYIKLMNIYTENKYNDNIIRNNYPLKLDIKTTQKRFEMIEDKMDNTSKNQVPK